MKRPSADEARHCDGGSISLSRALSNTYLCNFCYKPAGLAWPSRVRMAWDVDNDTYAEPKGGHPDLRDLRGTTRRSKELASILYVNLCRIPSSPEGLSFHFVCQFVPYPLFPLSFHFVCKLVPYPLLA